MSERTRREPCGHEYPHAPHSHRNPAWGKVGSDEPYKLRCPGIKVPDSARHYAPGVRRAVLADLRKASKYLSFSITDWAVDSRVWESATRTERPRRIEEYPENSRKAWSELSTDLDTLISALSRVRTVATQAAEHLRRVELEQAAQQLDEGAA